MMTKGGEAGVPAANRTRRSTNGWMAPAAKDFKKRPKAKVGKRAPAKINSTDTSFKTANVAVRSQDQSLGKNKYAPSNQGKDVSLASAAARMELVSSRGNVLSTLQQSLRHHAPAVRSSGLKGIRDAVQSLSSLGEGIGSSILEANLPSLLPNMCRCWLDEDDDVRSLAIHLFGDIITNLSSSSEQTYLKCMAPFVPFLCAYASSALNSLDRDIRKDGALIVSILASSDPSPSFAGLLSSLEKVGGISAMSVEMGKHVDSFLPPLERLLSSMSLGGRGRNSAGSNTSGPKAKKQKRDGNKSLHNAQSSLTASDSTLLSLAFLLHSSQMTGRDAISSNRSNSNTNRRLDPSMRVSLECTYLISGSARANSLSVLRDDRIVHNYSYRPIRSIFDLPVMPQDESADSHDDTILEEGIGLLHNPSGDEASKIDTMQQLTSLLEILRSKYVELLHSGRKLSNQKDGIMIPASELETLDVLVHIIRFVHRRYQSHLTLADKLFTSMKSTNSKKREKKTSSDVQDMGECLAACGVTVNKTLIFLIESFPICHSDDTSASRYELTNAGICSAMAELGAGHQDNNISQTWIDVVFSYILPRLNSADGSEKAACELVKVVGTLVLPHHGLQGNCEYYLLAQPQKRHELLESFAKAFFPHFEMSNYDEQQLTQVASTTTGITSAMLLSTLITQSADCLLYPPIPSEIKHHEMSSLLLLRMTSVLPAYIASWEDRFPNETGIVLTSLISLVRQWSEEDDHVLPVNRALNDLCLGLRNCLDVLFIGNMMISSNFERFPEYVQTLCVGLIGLLKRPSGALVKSLSNICSRSFAVQRMSTSNSPAEDVWIRNIMSTYIMEIVASLRKTIPMPSYLTFLLDSSGIEHASSNSMLRQNGVIEMDQFSYDRSVDQLCQFLTTSCDHPSTKVLPMISPILQKWFSSPLASTNDTLKYLIQARAATSILAAFTWEEVRTHESIYNKPDFVTPIFLKLEKDFDSLFVDSIIHQFELSTKLWSGYTAEDQQVALMRLLEPIKLLLRYRQGRTCDTTMLAALIAAICDKTKWNEDASSENSRMNSVEVNIRALLLILKAKGPVSVVQMIRTCDGLRVSLATATCFICSTVSGGHLANLGRKLEHQSDLILN